MSAPGDTREGRQQLDDRQPGNYEGQRGPAPRQEGPLVGEGEAGIRFGFPDGLDAPSSFAASSFAASSFAASSFAALGSFAPMILIAVTRLRLLSGVAHGNTEPRDTSVQWTSCHGS